MGRVWDIAVLLSCISMTACLTTTLPKPEIPEECQRRGICENVHNYPTELAKKLIEQLREKNVLFNYDEGQEATTSGLREKNVLFNYGGGQELVVGGYSYFNVRFGDEEETEQILCDSKKSYVAPKSGKHESGSWKYILDDGSTQRFRTEICNSLNATCNGEFLDGLTSKCIQNYILKEMYYIDDKQQPDVGYFQLESCCSCVLISEYK